MVRGDGRHPRCRRRTRVPGNLESLYETADEEGGLWRELVAAWWGKYQDRPVAVSELAELCRAGNFMAPVLGDGVERSQMIRLGKALKSARDRVYGAYRVCLVRERHEKQNQYRLVLTEEAP